MCAHPQIPCCDAVDILLTRTINSIVLSYRHERLLYLHQVLLVECGLQRQALLRVCVRL